MRTNTLDDQDVETIEEWGQEEAPPEAGDVDLGDIWKKWKSGKRDYIECLNKRTDLYGLWNKLNVQSVFCCTYTELKI